MVYDDFITLFAQNENAVRFLLNTLIREKIEEIAAEIEQPVADELADLERQVLDHLEKDPDADEAYRDLSFQAGQVEIAVQDAIFRAGVNFGATLADMFMAADLIASDYEQAEREEAARSGE